MYPVNSPAEDWYAENEERTRNALQAYRVNYRLATMLPFPVAPTRKANGPEKLPRSVGGRLKLIKRVVCQGAGISEEKLRGPCRRRETAAARAVFYHFSRRLTDASLTRIGLEVGRMDHATVVFALRRIESNPEGYAGLMAYVRSHVELPEEMQDA